MTCDFPPVRFQTSHESTVPNLSRPVFARFARRASDSSSQRSLTAREVGIEDQTGPGPDIARVPPLLEVAAYRPSAAVLPDYGGRERLARGGVPQNGGLTLIGDADCGQRGLVCPESLGGGLKHRFPQFAGVLLHPTVGGVRARNGGRIRGTE